GEHLARLRTDVDRRILGDLAGQVDHPVVDAGLGHPRADVQALNRHDSSWDRKRSTASIWSRAMNVGAWPTPSKAMHCAPGPRWAICAAVSADRMSDCAPRTTSVGQRIASYIGHRSGDGWACCSRNGTAIAGS